VMPIMPMAQPALIGPITLPRKRVRIM
jgi:hypothetical protein